MTVRKKDEGVLLVVSGPSGAGKGTICNALRQLHPEIRYSISVTTRPQRVGEVDGVNYFFTTEENFRKMLAEDAFLEYAEVYTNLYGTPRKQVLDMVKDGQTVLLEIDIQGAMQVKKKFPSGIFIYVVPPSLQELSHRLYARDTDTQEVIQARLNKVTDELALAHKYDYIVVNDKLDEAVDKVRAIMVAERCKLSRNQEQINHIFDRYIIKEVL
ncbi:MAG: guanylate kinase [Veillonellaceae bacterium]|nr:guanylate kinase [Veillonellaceae bacterium]